MLMIIGITVLGFGIGMILLLLQQNNNIITRLLQISFQESTFIGRIIYYLDGIKILVQHPFGLGYMGYSYLYPQVQTADYAVKFVHNDLLQQGLDTGIIPMLILAYLWISNILDKKTTTRKRQMLVLMFLHMLLEFDMQFLVLQLILVMLLEETEGQVTFYRPKAKLANAMVLIVLVGIFGYFRSCFMGK